VPFFDVICLNVMTKKSFVNFVFLSNTDDYFL
jgi:hypothetical protein